MEILYSTKPETRFLKETWSLLRPIFYLLYHQFAWTYDFVAAVVSLGQWKDWVLTALPYIEGRRVLELGHGPGHLQLALHERGFQTFGLDESKFMSRQARRRLKQRPGLLEKPGLCSNLTRGYAQSLPFSGQAFDTLVATFPAKYILDPRTLDEAHRVLRPGGRLVVLPLAWITGRRALERLMAWLFRVTGEVTGAPGELPAAVKGHFTRAGFEVRKETAQLKSSTVLVIVATKRPGF